MLNRLDDYPIHQTPEPLAHPANSDHNFYDRYWFNGYTDDGEHYFGIGMAIYPHRRIIDAAVSTVSVGGRQHSFFGSGTAPLERTDTSIGPFRIEIEEPMRRTRVILDDNPSGVACDLTFSTRTAAIQEKRQTIWDGSRRTMDATRFDQFGRWSGTLVHPDGELQVDETTWLGTKDRSWGVRNVGDQPTSGPSLRDRGFFFLWTPLIWDDHVSHAIFFDAMDGTPLVREGLTAPLFDTEADVVDAPMGLDTRMLTAIHRLEYTPGTRRVSAAEVDLIALDGSVRTIEHEMGLTFQMSGIGYQHPQYGHGTWLGELAMNSQTIDPEELNPLAMENLHTQQIVKVNDGERTGIGVLEHICIGAYKPYGFTDYFSGA